MRVVYTHKQDKSEVNLSRKETKSPPPCILWEAGTKSQPRIQVLWFSLSLSFSLPSSLPHPFYLSLLPSLSYSQSKGMTHFTLRENQEENSFAWLVRSPHRGILQTPWNFFWPHLHFPELALESLLILSSIISFCSMMVPFTLPHFAFTCATPVPNFFLFSLPYQYCTLTSAQSTTPYYVKS